MSANLDWHLNGSLAINDVSNVSNDTYWNYDLPRPRPRLFAGYITEAALGLVVNTILICAIVLGSHTSKQVHIQLINLAIADALNGIIVCAQAHISKGLPSIFCFPDSLPLCAFCVCLCSSLNYICLLWGTVIAAERFFVVHYPLKVHLYTLRKKLIVTVGVWTTSFALGIVHAVQAKVFNGCSQTSDVMDTYCFGIMTLFSPSHFYYSTIVSMILVTNTIMMYILIACRLRGRRQIGETAQPDQQRQAAQITIMLAVDASFNLLCTSVALAPLIEQVIDLYSCEKSTFSYKYRDVIYAIGLGNCFITPILYFIFNQTVRKDILDLFQRICGGACRQKKKSSTNRAQRNQKDGDRNTSPHV